MIGCPKEVAGMQRGTIGLLTHAWALQCLPSAFEARSGSDGTASRGGCALDPSGILNLKLALSLAEPQASGVYQKSLLLGHRERYRQMGPHMACFSAA